jgi:hypothetical protein
VIRVRRHPPAGLLLLAILIPLLAAGPGMPCAGTDVEHHAAAGHLLPDDPGAHGVQTGHSEHAGHAAHDAHAPDAHTGDLHLASLVPTPDADPDAPGPLDCAMGMMCSGTVVPPLAVTVADVPSVAASPDADGLWTLHTVDPTLPERPPTA